MKERKYVSVHANQDKATDEKTTQNEKEQQIKLNNKKLKIRHEYERFCNLE